MKSVPKAWQLSLVAVLVASAVWGWFKWKAPTKHITEKPSLAEVQSLKNEVKRKVQNTFQWDSAFEKMKLFKKDTVYVGADSETTILMGDRSIVLKENTIVVIDQETADTNKDKNEFVEFKLVQGRAKIDNSKQLNSKPIYVRLENGKSLLLSAKSVVDVASDGQVSKLVIEQGQITVLSKTNGQLKSKVIESDRETPVVVTLAQPATNSGVLEVEGTDIKIEKMQSQQSSQVLKQIQNTSPKINLQQIQAKVSAFESARDSAQQAATQSVKLNESKLSQVENIDVVEKIEVHSMDSSALSTFVDSKKIKTRSLALPDDNRKPAQSEEQSKPLSQVSLKPDRERGPSFFAPIPEWGLGVEFGSGYASRTFSSESASLDTPNAYIPGRFGVDAYWKDFGIGLDYLLPISNQGAVDMKPTSFKAAVDWNMGKILDSKKSRWKWFVGVENFVDSTTEEAEVSFLIVESYLGSHTGLQHHWIFDDRWRLEQKLFVTFMGTYESQLNFGWQYQNQLSYLLSNNLIWGLGLWFERIKTVQLLEGTAVSFQEGSWGAESVLRWEF